MDRNEMLLDFVAESRETLDKAEGSLLDLEKIFSESGETDSELLNSIFRDFHTIKGTSGFFELSTIVRVAHEAETILDVLRKGLGEFSVEYTDILIQACDVIRSLFDIVEDSGQDRGMEEEANLLVSGLSSIARELQVTVSGETVSQPGEGPRFGLFDEEEDGAAPSPPLKKFGLFEEEEERAPETAETQEPEADAEAETAATPGADIMVTGDMMIQSLRATRDLLHQTEDTQRELRNHPESRELTRRFMELLDRVQTNSDLLGLSVPADMLKAEIQRIEDILDEGVIRHLDRHLNSTQRIVDALHNILDALSQQETEDREVITEQRERSEEGIPAEQDWVSKREDLAEQDGVSEREVIAAPDGVSEREVLAAPDGESEREVLAAPDRESKQEEIPEREEESEREKEPSDETAAVDTAASGSPAVTPLPSGPGTKESAGRDGAEAATQAPVSSGGNGGLPKKPRAGITGVRAGGERRDIRISTEKLDTMLDIVGELVIAEAIVTQHPDLEQLESEGFRRSSQQLSKIVRHLQETALSMRMVPVSGVFQRMNRLVRDLSRKSGKEVELEIRGEETEVDKSVVELIGDPLVHILRNGIDHGLEEPDERSAAGKPPTGHILLEATHSGSEVHINVHDDGRGLNREKILNKAVRMGILNKNPEEMTDPEIWNLVFLPGFSTAETVSDISGRGVGLDVVRRNIQKLNGRIDIHTRQGKGSNFVLRIPLTLAIIEGVVMRIRDTYFVVPTVDISEFLQYSGMELSELHDNQRVLNIRGHFVPVVGIQDIVNLRNVYETISEKSLVVVIHHGEHSVGIIVDEIIGNQHVVIKSISDLLGNPQGVAGCTILGNGEVGLILDVQYITGRFRYDAIGKKT